MKMKSLAIITLLVLGCSFASAQTFGFESVGHGLYCNYEVLEQLAPYNIYQGIDVLNTCGAPVNATIAGQKTNLVAAGNPAGFNVDGVSYADNIYDAFALGYTGAQWEVASALRCNNRHYGWIGFASVSGFIFGDNYGYLSCTIPGPHNAPTKGLSIGNAEAQARK
jgi:hypothetical protein